MIASLSSLSSASSDDEDKEQNSLVSDSSPQLPGMKYKPIVLPRILVADIRRRYTFMFANVLNSYDCNLIDSFIQRFTIPSVALEKESFCASISLIGKTLLSTYLSLSLQTSPDKILRITETQIKQRSDRSGSELISSFDLNFTKIFEVHPGIIAESVVSQFKELSLGESVRVEEREDGESKLVVKKNENETIINNNNNNSSSSSSFSSSSSSSSDLFQSIDRARPHLSVMKFPRLPQPYQFHVQGKLIFSLNNQKRIEKIVFRGLAADCPSGPISCLKDC
jgi:hypothetical protein